MNLIQRLMVDISEKKFNENQNKSKTQMQERFFKFIFLKSIRKKC